MQDFRNLKVWEKSHKVVLDIYGITRNFPKEELYGLTSQIRRCAVSVPSNIAEGCCRGSECDFKRFLQIAICSASEIEYQLLLSKELDYLQEEEYLQIDKKVKEVKKMLVALIKKLSAFSH